VNIVLGVSMTPTTVRMVLVEGDRADGATVDHDVFDITAAGDSANSTAAEQVISAILGTQQSALAGGHRLTATGVTWTDHDDAAALRDALAAHGIEDVTLVSELHAAGALAQAAGRAVGYDKTALMLVDRDSATLSVVETGDGSIVKVMTRSLHSADAMAVLTEMVSGLEAQPVRPDGMFVLGAGVDVSSVKDHLEHLVSIPVSAPDDAEMALTRGAAIAAANTPRFEASTVGLAYSQDPEIAVDPAFVDTELAAVGGDGASLADAEAHTHRPFLLVGSTLTSVFVIGVVALVISLAVSIRPTVDQRPNPGDNVVAPSTVAPAPPHPQPAQQAQQVAPPPATVQQPPPETIPAPVPVVQEQPQVAPAPRTVVAVPQAPPPAPAPAAPAPEPAAPPPPPEAVPAPPPAVYPQPAPAPVPGIYPPIIGFPLPHPYRPPWRQPRQAPWEPPVQQPPWQQPQQPYIPQQPSGPSGPWCGPGYSCSPY